jgi:hypothetical protein
MHLRVRCVVLQVARYQLILGNVYKNTEVDDPRRTLIAVALESMQDLACQVNQQVAAHQEAQVRMLCAATLPSACIVRRCGFPGAPACMLYCP